MAEFDRLMGEIGEILLKAQAVDQAEDDKKIAAAAAGADQNDGGKDGKGDKTAEGAKADDEVFGKSFAVTLENGEKAEAYDGTKMLKALYLANKELGKTVAEQAGQLVGAEKAVASIVPLLKSLQGQVETQG